MTKKSLNLNSEGELIKSFNETISLLNLLPSCRAIPGYEMIVNKNGIISIDNGIEGWMSNEDLLWLFNMAKEMNSVVEIGSWKGRSTHALLSGCKGIVYAVDHFLGSIDEREGEQAEAKVRDIYKDFIKNVGDFKNLRVLRKDNNEAIEQFRDNSVDMVFIDAGHTYEEVLGDIKRWLPKAKCIICGHDGNDEQVKKAVGEIFSNNFEMNKGDIWIKRISPKL